MQKLLCSSVLLVVASFVASANGQTSITLPPLNDPYQVQTGDSSCSAVTAVFPTAWASTTSAPSCSSVANVNANYVSFKAGFTTFAPFTQTQWNTIVSEATCTTAIVGVEGDPAKAVATAMCTKLKGAADNCLCGRLACATDEANKAVTTATAAICNPYGKKVCDFFRNEVNLDCGTATAPQSFGTAGPTIPVWDPSAVNRACTTDKCNAANVATTTAPTTTTSSSAGLKVSYVAFATAAALAGVSAAL